MCINTRHWVLCGSSSSSSVKYLSKIQLLFDLLHGLHRSSVNNAWNYDDFSVITFDNINEDHIMFDDPKNVGTCTFFYQDSDYSNYSGR